MAFSQSTVPMRWPSGPLDIARQSKVEGFTPAARTALERWHEPAALDFIKNSPVDCLVISWAGGLPEDAAQQKTIAPLVAEAHKRTLSVIGWVDGKVDSTAAIASAKAAGLDAVAIEGFTGKSVFPVITWADRAKTPWDAASPVLAVTDNVWTGVRGATTPAAGEEATEAGPTAAPWLDFNSWFVQLARARVSKPVWMLFDPPGKGAVITAQAYSLAIADQESRGGRWVLSLDEKLRAGLASGDAAAQKIWQSVSDTITFFAKQHVAWRNYKCAGIVGVISNYTGDNYEMSGEILNLSGRRDLLCQPIWTSRAATTPFTGLKALVYADTAKPAPALRTKMMAFVQQGGLLITGPGWGNEGVALTGAAAPQMYDVDRYDVRAVGKGRLAVAKSELLDPWEVAADVNTLVSYGNDLFKFFNSSSTGCNYYTVAPDGKSAVLHGFSFAPPRGVRTAWLRDKHLGAKLWTIGAAAPVPLKPVPAEHFSGEEYQLPAGAIQNYIALEFEV